MRLCSWLVSAVESARFLFLCFFCQPHSHNPSNSPLTRHLWMLFGPQSAVGLSLPCPVVDRVDWWDVVQADLKKSVTEIH